MRNAASHKHRGDGSAMNYIERTQRWLDNNRDLLMGYGNLWVAKAPEGRVKSFIHIAVERPDRFFCEIIVWDSGEAVFAFGEPSKPSEENHDLIDSTELDLLLNRMLARVAD
jgi:hypothetical protein